MTPLFLWSLVWKVDLLTYLFDASEANLIVGMDDFLVWQHDSSGIYSVGSGYKVLLDLSSNTLQDRMDQHFYNRLWNLELPKKILLTVRRFHEGFVPVKVALSARGIISVSLCHFAPETVPHICFECPHTCTDHSFVGTAPSVGHPPRVEVWTTPPSGIYKVNFDVTFCAASGMAEMTLVRVWDVHSPFVAEALFAIRAIIFTYDQDVILEGGSLTVIKKLSSTALD
ncbi:hypothetical protein J1N35_035343 [Gossypium stocksii]|uniref:Reverse transcriptase zinc-binding domain-containing protein n=1 Tax=Gossypium stocksii TaxID=47602 RepID=A0A9D3ZR05_9ROSI|nr:hypothetical protein J1N35_035343 [Gossypium stocksii]